jgi:putative PIN family toxin of toxin-antitoxin system
MKITVDTNILISATFWTGDSHRIILKAENKEIELVLSREIIEEFCKVLKYNEIADKIQHKNLEILRTVENIVSMSILVEPTEHLDIVKDDPDDNIVLECAKAGNSDYIITQDNHLLRLGQFEGIKILTPKQFLNVLQFN